MTSHKLLLLLLLLILILDYFYYNQHCHQISTSRKKTYITIRIHLEYILIRKNEIN